VTANDVNIAAVSDTNPTTITNNTVSNATDAAVGSGQGIEVVSTTEGNITGNQITGNQGGGIGNYGTTGGTISGNTITGNSGSVAGTVPTVCATVSPCEVGGGIIDAGTTGGTIGGATANTISSNDNGGVLLQGSSGGTVSNNTISNNIAGGVLLQVAFGATVSGNTLTSDASGGVVGEDPPPGSSPCTANPATSPCQNSGNQITGNTVSGTSGAAVQLTLTGGDTISGNGVSGLGEGGEGFIMVASDNNMVNTNTVSSSAAGVVITGNDLTGPSVNNTVSNNDFSANLLGGAAVDGFGSPESWNGPGRGDQGIEGEVFFQSGIAVGLGPTNGTGSPETVVTPTSFAGLPGAFSAVVEYLAGAGAICGSSGIPVDADGYTGPNPNLVACTDGTNIDIEGVVTAAILAGNGDATGPSTTLEPGCINPAPAGEGEPNCTGSVLTLSLLPSINTVAEGNSLTNNVWNNETIAGAIDGSGPNGQFTASSTPFTDSDPTPPGGIQNTWTGNTGSPGNSPADPNTADPAAGG
jgi:parallel beta-helix repeat protein